jgi:phenylacetate-CoA ligase
VYQLFPNVALLRWETAERMGVDPRSLNLRYPKQRPAAQYASASAGIECLAYLGSACREFNGAHVAEDMCIVEVVDPVSGEPVPDGVRGHLVCTSIAKDNFLLRYDLEDVVRMDASPCACGEASARLWWEGRASEIVRAGGRDVLPIDVWNAVGTPTFQIVRGSPPRIRVELDEAPPVEGFVVECVPRGTLERPEFKPVRVVEEA